MRAIEQRTGIWRLSLEQIEATVADHLGRGRVPGNQTGPLFQSADFNVSGEERGRLEHNPDRPFLQRSPPHHRSSRDSEDRTSPKDG